MSNVIKALPSFQKTSGRIALFRYLMLVGILLFNAPQLAAAEEPSYVRVSKRINSSEPAALETATVQLRSTAARYKGVVIDLVAAVHVGEADYYSALNKQFKNYDAVLYEMISAEGESKPVPANGEQSTLSAIQGGVKDLLGLEFQLNKIDYSPANFVHADLSTKGLSNAMAARGDSLVSTLVKLVMQGVNDEQNLPADPQMQIGLLLGFFSPDKHIRQLAIRRYLAREFSKFDRVVERIEGPHGSALISDRNDHVIKVAAEVLRKGKKNIAIFFGAAHLPDLEKKLASKFFGFSRVSQSWLLAWRLEP